ncbi:type II toxin-antitoxin system VapC family toxin [Bosea sp. OK403]|uniref:PIN domain-containing protein n=1 Tax=Bosea sp. OK403 TaxID=1855286 RepID=UPI000B832CC3|nr:type II toxin-antitoxin system VapC family toxin [Bosea sp. OK403]
MIGVDTNILLRALMDDDPVQSPAARAYLNHLAPARPGYVNLIVLAELTWTLRSRFKANLADVLLAVEALLDNAVLVIEARESVAEAVEIARSGRSSFSDAMIGLVNRHAGCMETMTFDRGAPSEAGFTVLT